MNSKIPPWNNVRAIEDALMTLVRAKDDMSVVGQWLEQKLLLAGADQQLNNQLSAEHRLASVHAFLLELHAQATAAARTAAVEDETQKSQLGT